MPSRKNIQTVGKVTLEYLERYPDLPTRTIARLMRDEQPELYKSVEHARANVRLYRGNSGKKKRDKIKHRNHFRENQKAGKVYIPKGISQTYPPLVINGPIKVLVLSDIHAPYHSEHALEAAIRHGVDTKCEAVYLNGDSIDFYGISRFVRDPRMRSPKKEVDCLGEILDEIAEHFPKRWYKCGNHDERWDVYLFTRAPDLVEFEEFALEKVLKLEEREYGFVHSKQWANLGKLNLLHGHELPRGISAPVNPARGLWLRLKETAMAGHFHQSSTHLEAFPLNQEVAVTWSTGCLCHRRPEFMPLNNWRHGFAIVEVARDGSFQVENFQIDRGNVFRV